MKGVAVRWNVFLPIFWAAVNVIGYSGYIMKFMPEHPEANNRGFVAEHRVVAEEILGRPLRKNEVVHHKDGNRHNNSPDNICVFRTRDDHSRYHQGGSMELQEDGTYISKFVRPEIPCAYCGRIFIPAAKNSKYCCSECSSLSQRKVVRPSKRELKKLLLEFNITQIAEIYGITGNGIRRWCAADNLPYKLKDIKIMREKERIKAEEKALEKEMKERIAECDRLAKKSK